MTMIKPIIVKRLPQLTWTDYKAFPLGPACLVLHMVYKENEYINRNKVLLERMGRGT